MFLRNYVLEAFCDDEPMLSAWYNDLQIHIPCLYQQSVQGGTHILKKLLI